MAAEIEVEIPELGSFINCLKAEGHIRGDYDANGQEQYVSRMPGLGGGQPAQTTPATHVSAWYASAAQPPSRKRKNDYFSWCAPHLVSALFLENRLTALNSTAIIDYATQPPQHDLHVLHLDASATSALIKEANRAFSKAVWPDASRGSIICMRVAQDHMLPSAEDRLIPQKMFEHRTIEDEGDGMKSYVSTCVSILLGRRPVCIIDEPEMCLHPPQAYNLGQFIGERATSLQTATFVATHSSQVLRGVIQTADSLKIVRLSKTPSGFHARQVDSDVLAEAMKKPTVRAETVLDGIFSQAVTIVEADSDRTVYQAAWEEVGGDLNFDIHFATVGGTGGIADTCRLYRVLGIPVAVVADLDVITDREKMKRILEEFCDDPNVRSDLHKKTWEISEKIRALPPNINEDEATDILKKLSEENYNWGNGDDSQLRSDLNDLGRLLNGMRGVKDGGLRTLPEDIGTPLQAVLAELETHGVFLVPCGELENWLQGCGIEASKRKKWAWANEAARYIHDNECQPDDIWAFVQRLGNYLQAKVS